MSDILKRREGESFFEWKLRLCLSKLNKELDEDWQELIDILGLDMSPCHLRKTAYGLKEYDNYIKTKTPELIGKEEYEKLLSKEIEIKKERVKLNDQRNLLNRQIRDLARKDNLGSILEEKLEKLPNQVLNMSYTQHETSKKQGIFCISDVHYGMTVDNFLNKYNPDIARERMSYLVDKVIEYLFTRRYD